jgi:hypothetical protein
MKPLLFLVIIILSTATSCRKVCDFIHDHPDAHASLCRITKIFVKGYFGNPDTFNIAYNTKGNPLSMLATSPPGTTGNVDQYYRYDRFERLSDYMYTFIGAEGAVSWHKYGYPRKDFVTDTSMMYIGNVHGPSPTAAAAGYYGITGYTLDIHGRVVKKWDIPNDPHQPPQLVETFTYDANGNRPLPDTLTYDNKVNIYRTNKTWQFVYNDYSRNNPVLKGLFAPQPSYNDFGLPVTLPNLESFNLYPFFLENKNPEMVIAYACSMPKGPIDY